jgi:hypothetical protein
MKRKRENEGPKNCILHFSECPIKGEFRLISNVKDPDQRLQKLRAIKQQRLQEPINSPHRYAPACNLLPDELTADSGYHDYCIKKFTSKYMDSRI